MPVHQIADHWFVSFRSVFVPEGVAEVTLGLTGQKSQNHLANLAKKIVTISGIFGGNFPK